MKPQPAPTGAPEREVAGQGDPFAGIELAIFDKDGTLIDFHRMWRGWVDDLAAGLEAGVPGLRIGSAVYDLMGVDAASGRVLPHGLLAATPMARIRDRVEAMLVAAGTSASTAASALEAAWHAPDPVSLASPLTDLAALFASLAAGGCTVAIATSDDRAPTERTLEALGVAPLVRALACADDGCAVKPAPDAVLHLCASIGVPPARTVVVGDSPADLAMGRAAGVARTIGVLSGVGDRAALAPLADVIVDSVADLHPGRAAAVPRGQPSD